MKKKSVQIGKNDALAIIDMQNDFINQDGALYVSGINGELDMSKILDNILNLINKPFEKIILSADQHPANHVEFGIFGNHCLAESFGGKINEEILEKLKTKNISYDLLLKGEDQGLISYSISTSRRFPEHIVVAF